LSGEATVIADKVQHDAGTWHTSFSVSDEGTFIYEPGGGSMGVDLLWRDRAGREMGKVGDRGPYRGLRLSPDGKRLAVVLGDPKADIWVYDLVRGNRRRLTFDQSDHFLPSWSGDGRRVFFTSTGGTANFNTEVHAKAVDGSGGDELLFKMPSVSLLWPQLTPDGRVLSYQAVAGQSGFTAWAVPLSGDRKPVPVVLPQSPQSRLNAQRLSPDGKWLAYSGAESGREEVYVTSFPSGSGRWQISQNGGLFPVWRGDSKEIYFIGSAAPIRMYAAELKVTENEIEVQSVRPLFATPNVAGAGELYDVSPDGTKFLIPTTTATESAPMTLVVNWLSVLEKK
ncbi:MAG TPA: hypothetical protein VFR84_18765, partial [Candidatus Angelobacter sp.]|nr:hypothetical protein [Candidatus Angelobacter sp.]